MASALHPEFLEYTWAPVRTNILEADLFVGAWAMVKTLTSVLALHSSGSTIRHVALPPPLTVVDVLGPPSPLPPSELSRWRDADDGKVDDVPTTSPTAALAPGCRVVVNPEARDGQRLGGFLAESISPTVVRVRLFVHGERIDPRERAFVDKLLSPGMVGDYGLFDIQNVKAHFLAGECNLKSSDLVYFNNGPRRGRHARFRIIRDRICTVVCAGEFVDVSLSDVARGFHVGDTVQVLHGTFAGAIGEITGLRSLASNFGCMDVTAGGILTINVTYYPQSLLCRTINVLAYFAIYLPPAPQPPVASTSTIAPTMENDHSAWLYKPMLVHKRLDIKVEHIATGPRPTGRINPVGRTGFFEPPYAITCHNDKVPVEVFLHGERRRLRIALRWFSAVRTIVDHPGSEPRCISKSRCRVLVIGPDVDGQSDAIGEYGFIFPDLQTYQPDGRVIVQLYRETIKQPQIRKSFPLNRLCLSKNEDGKRSCALRFFRNL